MAAALPEAAPNPPPPWETGYRNRISNRISKPDIYVSAMSPRACEPRRGRAIRRKHAGHRISGAEALADPKGERPHRLQPAPMGQKALSTWKTGAIGQIYR